MTQQPTIPVQQTTKSTYRAACKLNGDDLPKLRRVKRPELSGRVALYNTFTRGVLNTTLNSWFRQHATVMDNLRKEQLHVYKSMCRMQRLRRRVQKDEHERRREEIRKMFQRQRKRHLMRRVVEKFKQNVVQKKQERLQEEELSQSSKGNGISTNSLVQFASGFRRMTEPSVRTEALSELERILENDTKEPLADNTPQPTLSSLSPKAEPILALPQTEDSDVSNHRKGLPLGGQEKENTKYVSPDLIKSKTQKLKNKTLKIKQAYNRKNTLQSIPETGMGSENDVDGKTDTAKGNERVIDFIHTPLTKSLPSDLSKLTLTDPVMNRRRSLPSKYKQAEYVSTHSITANNFKPTVVQKGSRPNSVENFSPSPPKQGTPPSSDSACDGAFDKTSPLDHKLNLQSSRHGQSNQDQLIGTVARANRSRDRKSRYNQTQQDSDALTGHSNTCTTKHKFGDEDNLRQSERDVFSHEAFYYSSFGEQNPQEVPNETLNQSALPAVRHGRQANEYYNDDDGDSVARRTLSRSPQTSDQSDSPVGGDLRGKSRKKNLVKQIRLERARKAEMRSHLLDSEPFTQYTRRGRAQVTPMYGLPKRKEFNPPTRKMEHEHGKMLRGVQDMDIQCQMRIDDFFKDLFEIKETKKKPQFVVDPEEDRPKRPALTLAGVLSQLYSAKDPSAANKNSFEWLKKCQYLRVYNPFDRKGKERSHEPKTSSWDTAERKLRAGFLSLM